MSLPQFGNRDGRHAAQASLLWVRINGAFVQVYRAVLEGVPKGTVGGVNSP